MPKWLKTVIAVLLLPFCFGAVKAAWRLIGATGNAELIWVALLAGAGCWLAVYLLLPKPMLLYVYGHELTHVIWTWLFGGKVKRFRATSRGGRVVITKSNCLIVLAPYFFPFYVVLVVSAFALGHLLWGWTRHLVWLHFFMGAAYAFHVTLTGHILRTRQSDITSQGYLFSAVVIFLGNFAVVLVGLPLLMRQVSLPTSLGWWLSESGAVLTHLRGWW